MPWNVSSVETVLGRQVIEDLGRILPHEHLCSDIREKYILQSDYLNVDLKERDITLDIRDCVKEYPYSSDPNLRLDDAVSKTALERDLKLFRSCGGKTIMENTSYNYGKRDIQQIRELSKATGVSVILGTGCQQQTSDISRETAYNEFYRDLIEGFVMPEDYPEVVAGFIGKLALNWPFSKFEKNMLAAAGEIQSQLQCVVTVAPSPDMNSHYEVLRYYQEAGGDEQKVLMLNIDRVYTDTQEFMEFLDYSSCYVGVDALDNESFYHQSMPNVCITSESEWIRRMIKAKEPRESIYRKEALHRILLSNNVHTKHQLKAFGGNGFSHVYNNIIPVLKKKGFTENEIDMLIIDNVQEWLRK